MFARSDDVNLAYNAALTVVNLSQPDQSHMVLKVAGGHNCWLSSPQACADILTTWIKNWAGGVTVGRHADPVAGAGRSRTSAARKTFPATASDNGAPRSHRRSIRC